MSRFINVFMKEYFLLQMAEGGSNPPRRSASSGGGPGGSSGGASGGSSAHGMYWPPASPEDKEVLIESRTVSGGSKSEMNQVW